MTSKSPAEKHELAVHLRAGSRLITIESRDEASAVNLFRHVAGETGYPLFQWTAASGLQRLDLSIDAPDKAESPEAILRHIRDRRDRSVFLLLDFHPYLDNPVHIRLLREIARGSDHGGGSVVLISPRLELPVELRSLAAPFELALPNQDILATMLREEVREWERQNAGKRVRGSRKAAELLLRNLAGLPLKDARRLARNAIWHDGAVSENDLPRVMEAKFKLLDPGGVLSFEMETERFADVAGLSRMKLWLEQRAPVFAAAETPAGLDAPKGVLLLGVQGCGKSVAARAVAGLFGVPLLRLDCGAIFNKYHGESERNLRESLHSAETMAPCVLWIDEIEKGLSVSDSDGGTSRRILGTILTWMAERREPVFMVATANDIDILPPELVRKGRFDEIFFVDLPAPPVRQSVLNIHLRRRGLDPSGFDVPALAAVSEGFSGAELEQAVVSALYAAHARGDKPTSKDVHKAIETTRPLSVVMRERVDKLRQWAASRTVPAD
jgi:hypothetical protein